MEAESEIDFDNVYSYGDFIGRRYELEKLNKLFNDKSTRYITINGFGGIGKTTLAIEAIKSFKLGRVLVLSLMDCPNSFSIISKIAGLLNIDVTAFENSNILRTEVLRKLKGREPVLFYLTM